MQFAQIEHRSFDSAGFREINLLVFDSGGRVLSRFRDGDPLDGLRGANHAHPNTVDKHQTVCEGEAVFPLVVIHKGPEIISLIRSVFGGLFGAHDGVGPIITQIEIWLNLHTEF